MKDEQNEQAQVGLDKSLLFQELLDCLSVTICGIVTLASLVLLVYWLGQAMYNSNDRVTDWA